MSASRGLCCKTIFDARTSNIESRRQRAMLIQYPLRHDSIIASKRLAVGFCNTIEGKAVVSQTWGNDVDGPQADMEWFAQRRSVGPFAGIDRATLRM
jgi:hypothetical protein